MGKRIILTGGGTVGHVSPALGLMSIIKEEYPDSRFLYIGRQNGPENDIVKKAKIPLFEVNVQGLTSKKPFTLIKTIKNTEKAIKKAREIIIDFSPDLIIGTGGYVSFPVVCAGQKLNVPTILHESNAKAGLVTKLLGKKCLYVLYGTKKTSMKKKEIYVGTPVKESFKLQTREQARKSLSLQKEDVFLVITGGSLGAEKLNELALGMIDYIQTENNLKVAVFTGKKYIDLYKNESRNNIMFIPFTTHMEDYLWAADVAVSRAGAGIISELSYTKTPVILIPSPNVKADHQTANANVVVDEKGGYLLNEKEATPETLWSKLRPIIKDEQLRNAMSENIGNLINSSLENALRQVLKTALLQM